MPERKHPSKECTVRFEPDNMTARVQAGKTILDAALESGVLIDSVCGGAGRCGRCKVRVRGLGGAADQSKTVLACTAPVECDLEVSVPEHSRIGVHQILETSENVVVKEISPMIRKAHLKVAAPSLKDNTSDADRLRRALRRDEDKAAHIPLSVMKRMPDAMRKGNWEVTVGISEMPGRREIISIEPGNTSKSLYGLAIDIGTTTVVVSLIDMISGTTVATESTYNKQIVFGEDVLSRITHAEENGIQKLTKPILETLRILISKACESATKKTGRSVLPEDILSAAISGNPTMIHFLLELETRNIRYEPYIPVVNAPHLIEASHIGIAINPNAIVYICPGRSSYVGGDILADVVASGMHLSKDLVLLIDVGTNGEAVLGCKDWMVSCSCSAGPAFEGGEVSSGMRAMTGAIDRIQIDPTGEVKFHTIGEAEPLGICGSGLIDLIAGLFINGFIDRHGNLEKGKSKRIREGAHGGTEFFIAKRGKGVAVKDWTSEGQGDIAIKGTDIQNILRTKAAIYAGCAVLLKTMGHDFKDVSQVVIAGGFGHYLDARKAVIIGLFPDVPMERFRFIGNGALEGARLALLSEQKRAELQTIYENMTYLELSVNHLFFEEFTSALFIPHTHLSRFPSVKDLMEMEKRAKR